LVEDCKLQFFGAILHPILGGVVASVEVMKSGLEPIRRILAYLAGLLKGYAG
jgi:hypothetical protein